MKLRDYIQVLPALRKGDCKNLISIFEKDTDNHIRNENEVLNFTELNLNRSTESSPELITWLGHTAKKLANDYFDQCPQGDRYIPKMYAFEEFRVKRYNKGDSFRPHVDVGDLNSSRRFLAFLFYLNDDFKGGGTQFSTPIDFYYNRPLQGNCLMFPPTWQYPHEGMEITEGTKYIMSTYLHYV